ncbi:tetratricopeptide repeat protein [Reinekea thalattae]|uniref:Tetratricopeptide repeat protein n=1 Tax=Reinekea thalattae TaxID=2593301 RepID=A0A5C8ZCG9_9GAMM|nr:hypothetical protein [Reinekea thalattae]TXR54540.1 hypothetical protein FME95_08395 [Reinekea thalattae]
MNKYTIALLAAVILIMSGCSLAPASASNSYNANDEGNYEESLRKIEYSLIKYNYSDEDTANLMLLKADNYMKLGESAYALGVLNYVVDKYPETEAAFKAKALLQTDKTLRSLNESASQN